MGGGQAADKNADYLPSGIGGSARSAGSPDRQVQFVDTLGTPADPAGDYFGELIQDLERRYRQRAQNEDQ